MENVEILEIEKLRMQGYEVQLIIDHVPLKISIFYYVDQRTKRSVEFKRLVNIYINNHVFDPMKYSNRNAPEQITNASLFLERRGQWLLEECERWLDEKNREKFKSKAV